VPCRGPLGSTLPRSVLPSSAMLPCPGVARAAGSRTAGRRKAISTAAKSSPWEDVADGGVRGCPLPCQREGRVQPAAMHGDEGDDVRRTSPFDAATRVAAGHDGEDGEPQHVGQLVGLSLRPARIRHVRQHIQQRREHNHGNLRPSCRRIGQTFSGSEIPLGPAISLHPAGVAGRTQYSRPSSVEQPLGVAVYLPC